MHKIRIRETRDQQFLPPVELAAQTPRATGARVGVDADVSLKGLITLDQIWIAPVFKARKTDLVEVVPALHELVVPVDIRAVVGEEFQLPAHSLNVKSVAAWTVAVFLAVVWLLITFIPFVFMVLNSFKGQFEMLTTGIFTLPEALNLANYRTVIEKGFLGYFFRSVVVTGVSLALMVALSAFASYPLSRMRFKLRGLLYGFIIACMSVPMHVTLIPVFKMTIDLRLYDTIWALPGPYVAFSLPMSVFILTNFMRGIPREIEEAAEIDGCGKFGMFFRIIVPLSKAGLSTLCIYNGINYWNEFAFVKTLTQSVKSQTLPMAMSNFKGEHSLDIPMILTVLTLAVLPMIILFCILQDKLVKGMTAGAVKG